MKNSVTLMPEQIDLIHQKFTEPAKLQLASFELNIDESTLRKLLENYKTLSALGCIKLPENQIKVFRKYWR